MIGGANVNEYPSVNISLYKRRHAEMWKSWEVDQRILRYQSLLMLCPRIGHIGCPKAPQISYVVKETETAERREDRDFIY
jgi:hypothetical protein